MHHKLRRSVLKHGKNRKTRKYRFRGGQSQTIKSPDREVYENYVNKYITTYMPVTERERFSKLSDTYKDAKMELLMLPKDPMFKNKDWRERARTIRNVLYRSSQPSQTQTQAQTRKQPPKKSIGYAATGQNMITATDVNAGLSLGSSFDDLCIIL